MTTGPRIIQVSLGLVLAASLWASPIQSQEAVSGKAFYTAANIWYENPKRMSDEIILMAYGYPPAHRTPSLEADEWVYWLNRFVNQPVVLRNGRVSQWQ